MNRPGGRTSVWPLAVVGVLLLALVAACMNDSETTTPTTEPAPPRYALTAMVVESEDDGLQVCINPIQQLTLPPGCGDAVLAGDFDWANVADRETSAGTTWGTAHLVGTFDGETFALTEPVGPPPDAAGHVADLLGSDWSPACDEPAVIDPAQGREQWDVAYLAIGEIPNLVTAWPSDDSLGWAGPFVENVIVYPGYAPATEALIRAHYGGPLCLLERDGPGPAEHSALQRELWDDAAKAALGVVYTSNGDESRGIVVAVVAIADDEAREYAARRWGERVELRGILQPVE